MLSIISECSRSDDVSPLRLSFACGNYDRMAALRTGDVTAEGIDLNYIAIDSPREIFDRMGSRQEFDVAEFSSSEFISSFARGDCPFVALSVFPSRVFRHSHIYINKRSDIKTPKDLEHKRVGVALYTQTAAVWIRGHLTHQYGVDLSTIRWVAGARHLRPHPDVIPIFADAKAVERAFYVETQIFPIMHLVAIRRDRYEREPWIAGSLYKAFAEAKNRALVQLRRRGAHPYML